MKEVLCIVGLGYVGLPLAVEFAKKGFRVIGFDVSSERIKELNGGFDGTNEVDASDLKSAVDGGLVFTFEESRIGEADIIIVTVPTPIGEGCIPDLSFVESASKIVGRNLKQGCIVVFESTVYPGVTEEVCLPILQDESGLKCPRDFGIGYSPERVNPGDKEHTIDKIVKIVSGVDEENRDRLLAVYGAITRTYPAKDIRTAEAAKVIENIQRDLNIALVNELSIIFSHLGLDTIDVLEAAESKWNFQGCRPGLVGGHCIPVDPYYLVHKARQTGYEPDVILAGRKINNSMADYVAETVVSSCRDLLGKPPGRALVLGRTFKENVNDVRTSQVGRLVNALEEEGVQVVSYDPLLDGEKDLEEVLQADEQAMNTIDAVVVAVPHDKLEKTFKKWWQSNKKRRECIVFDVKGKYRSFLAQYPPLGYLRL